MDNKKKIYDLLSSEKYCVIGTTSSEGKSQCAVMELTVDSDRSFFLATRSVTRKYKNLQNNKNASIVAWKDWTEVQLDGEAEIVEKSDSRYDEIKEKIINRHPDASNHLDETTVFIKITPLWARYSSFTAKPPEIFEVNF